MDQDRKRTLEGELKKILVGMKQNIELRVEKVIDVGPVDLAKYPLPKTKHRHSFTVSRYEVDGKIASKEEHLEIDRKLKLLNKPAVKSIQSEDGDIIDCVDLYKQPAFDHPALKNHTIQMTPSYFPKTNTATTATKKNNSSIPIVSQLWHKSGSCPKGTVPIRRIQKEDLLRSDSLENFGRKSPYVTRSSNRTQGQGNLNEKLPYLNGTSSLLLRANHSAAFLLTQGYSYIGASGDINVWNPNIEGSDDYSTAQIWLNNGPSESFESIEVGWMVNPKLYGDKRTRLFVHWTTDAGKTTGCFDLFCKGFVHTSEKIALGAAIDPVSVEHGPQYQLSFFIFLEGNNWFLRFGDYILGYWPGELFSSLSRSASSVRWGGEVYSPTIGKPGVPHTATTMGSGEYASSLFGFATFIQHVRIVDYSFTARYPEWVAPYADEPGCYAAFNYVQYTKEPEFYFGGPGRCSICT